MTRERYESLSLVALKDLAKARGLKGISLLKKAALIDRMLEEDAKEETAKKENQAESDSVSQAPSQEEKPQKTEQTDTEAAAPSVQPEKENDQSNSAAEAPTRPQENHQRTYIQRQPYMQRQTYTPRGERPYQNQNGSRQEHTARPYTRRPQENQRSNYQRQDYQRSDYQRQNYQRQDSQRTDYQRQDYQRTDYQRQDYQRQDSQRTDYQRSNYQRQDDRKQEEMRSEAPEVQVSGTIISSDSHETDRVKETVAAPSHAQDELTAKNEAIENSQAETAQANANAQVSDDRPSADLSQLDSGITVEGMLEVMQDGYGFIRSSGYMPGENDIYVSPSQIRRFNLRTGDIIQGNTRIKTMQEKFSALLYLKSVNGLAPGVASRRTNFENMTPIFPNQRLKMERDSRNIAMRLVDLICPIGKGQRGMIVSQPKAGKTTLLKDIARSILKNSPETYLIILLIDERPEEVTDIREAIVGDCVEVVDSTFDEQPEHHKRVSEIVIERAKRMVENHKDVVILLDSITRLARAYNLIVPPSGRTLSGGLDPTALYMPKRFFGAARNMREGGSLTILATALVDTGSKMDDVVYEEFKGTGNMELVLDRKLSERRVFPAIDIPKSSTRREDLLLTRDEQDAMYIIRKALNGMKSDDAVENILNLMTRTKDNYDFVQNVKRQRFI